jgi:hypothetical protein
MLATIALFESSQHELRAHGAVANEATFLQRIVQQSFHGVRPSSV